MTNLAADLRLLADEQRDIAKRLRQKALRMSYGPGLEAHLMGADKANDKAGEYDALAQVVLEGAKGIA